MITGRQLGKLEGDLDLLHSALVGLGKKEAVAASTVDQPILDHLMMAQDDLAGALFSVQKAITLVNERNAGRLREEELRKQGAEGSDNTDSIFRVGGRHAQFELRKNGQEE